MSNDILSNDDISLDPIDDDSFTVDVNNPGTISDESDIPYIPIVNPIAYSDDIERDADGWTKDNTPNGGEPGEEYSDVPPQQTPREDVVYKTIKRKIRKTLDNFNPDYLEDLSNTGFKFYAIYTDGTEDEVQWNEVFDPVSIVDQTVIDEAHDIALATNQHFWTDDNGAHITDVEQDEWNYAVVHNFNDISDNKPYHNALINSLGLLFRRALNNLVSISKSAIAFYDGAGNTAANILASFGSTGAQINSEGKKRVSINKNGLRVYDNTGTSLIDGATVASIGIDSNGNPFSRIGRADKGHIDIGISDGYGYTTIKQSNTVIAHMGYGNVYDLATNDPFDPSTKVVQMPYYTFGTRAGSKIGVYSIILGSNNEASGVCSFCAGASSNATLPYSFVHGALSRSDGYGSQAFGYKCKNYGYYSFLGGYNSTNYGWDSCIYGFNIKGGDGQKAGSYDVYKGSYSAAFGYGHQVNSLYGMTAGRENEISSFYNFAFGYGLKKTVNYGLACGQFNSDTGANFVVGWGSNDSSRYDRFKINNSGAYVFGTLVHSSDRRVKTDIEELDTDKSIKFIKALKPSTFLKDGLPDIGFVAQDIEELDPDYSSRLVTLTKNGPYDDYRVLNYNGLVAPIVSTLQEYITRIEELEKENAELKKRLDIIEEVLGF